MPDFPVSSAELERLMPLGRASVWNPINKASHGFNLTTDEHLMLKRTFTLSNPGTTLTTVFDIAGSGYLLGLAIAKPITVNSVGVNARITLDGAVILNDADITPIGGGTGAVNIPLVGNLTYAGSALTNLLLTGPIFVPFHRGLKLEARFGGIPGGSENLTGSYILVYA